MVAITAATVPRSTPPESVERNIGQPRNPGVLRLGSAENDRWAKTREPAGGTAGS